MNTATALQKVRTTPNRPISHPVSGTAIPFETANAVSFFFDLSLYKLLL